MARNKPYYGEMIVRKECVTCRRYLIRNELHFEASSQTGDGFRSECKQCRNATANKIAAHNRSDFDCTFSKNAARLPFGVVPVIEDEDDQQDSDSDS